ncbi:30S ribosomal protein S18 [Candidatus Gottesmanbacteria bacterium RBG_16_52_11]|uniref:Small ribosomal subunit protein bS18 n=1 Tax=Candidatus Gottesmanbacteria bacterium RBG_16_52_11 TaxID=1798374 RepID=A0A1F5YPA3_9BACT|nr:MAG: 30S ribosomal protein S18 [Candidatus Gottesmanbacteria bacterium RBG_16_52_11]
MVRIQSKTRHQPKNCMFCDSKTEPHFREISVLEKYMTERGKIVGRNRSGLCSRHQRSLTREIKRARYIALLPYVVRI